MTIRRSFLASPQNLSRASLPVVSIWLSTWNRWRFGLWIGWKKKTIKVTRSIQRTETPPRLWYLTLLCDLVLTSRSRKLMSLDVAFFVLVILSVGLTLILYEKVDLHLRPSTFVKDTHTHRQKHKLQWKYNSSTISRRCNKSNKKDWCKSQLLTYELIKADGRNLNSFSFFLNLIWVSLGLLFCISV